MSLIMVGFGQHRQGRSRNLDGKSTARAVPGRTRAARLDAGTPRVAGRGVAQHGPGFRKPAACASPLDRGTPDPDPGGRSEEHTSELQSLMRISYAVFCLKQKKTTKTNKNHNSQ